MSESKAVASETTASIACELCRTKKQKCDRKTPICSQCANAPEKCHYPEQNRRGLPAGYLNSLEKRLVETERALFFALAEIHAGTVEEGEYSNAGLQLMKPSSQTKTELVQSWTRNPLENRTDVRSWFVDRQHDLGIASESSIGANPPVRTNQPSLSTVGKRQPGNEPWAMSIGVGITPPSHNPDSTFDPRISQQVNTDASWRVFGLEAPSLHPSIHIPTQALFHQQNSPSTPSDTRSVATQHPGSTSGAAPGEGRASGFAKDNQNMYF